MARDPAAGHAVTIGPLRGRRLALELVEQLDSLFGLRHCGRRLPRREYPSAYGQMGRCLSPGLGDLDPNLYRRRLDEALWLFMGGGASRLLEHVGRQMRASSDDRRDLFQPSIELQLLFADAARPQAIDQITQTGAAGRSVVDAFDGDGRRRHDFHSSPAAFFDGRSNPLFDTHDPLYSPA